MNIKFETPILFLIFNRSDCTTKVFDVIREIKPSKLFIASDGARNETEQKVVEQIRIDLMGKIDWDCDLKTLYRDKNLGCKLAVSSSINWFFENVESGIILEDDCLPDKTFFNYCQILLEKYKDSVDVMHIGGNNFQNGIKRGDASYYFSNYNHIWGWATWRRAWKKYDVKMSSFKLFRDHNKIKNIWQNWLVQRIWMKKFKSVYSGKLDTWDYQWTYAIWENKGVCIVPNVNLVSNIGFGELATHTKTKNIVADMAVTPMNIISHPGLIVVDQEADNYYNLNLRWCRRLINKIKAYL